MNRAPNICHLLRETTPVHIVLKTVLALCPGGLFPLQTEQSNSLLKLYPNIENISVLIIFMGISFPGAPAACGVQTLPWVCG